ncbi:MAG: HIT family protein [Acidimicrobiales bacterium]|nr:HIT family protein [Acidimicrobiales bacterium]
MATVFTRIIQGEIPGRIIWRDDRCVAMLDIRPLHRGHVLVIPVAEVDRWTDLSAETAVHCFGVAHSIGRAQQEAFDPARIGLMIAGFEVPHAHIHVVPIDEMADLDFSRADADADSLDLDRAAEELRNTLRAHGHGCVT